MKDILLTIVFLTVTTVSHSSKQLRCDDSLEWAKKVADPLSDFTVLLYRAISVSNVEKNIVFSPASISLSLALLKAGAEGATRTQMRYLLVKRGSNDSDSNSIYQSLYRQLIQSGEPRSKGVTLNILNGLYHRPGINLTECYSFVATQCFGAVVEECDFQNDAGGCQERMNTWMASSTALKIPQIFQTDDINSETIAVLANAIHFKAPWYEMFPVRQVIESEFYRFGNENHEQSVQYLVNEDQYLYTQTSAVSVVGIPYKGYQFYMYIILPKKRDGLEDFEKTFTGTELMFLINRTTVREVEVHIPKFKVKTHVDLKPILTSLGLNGMFTDAANFSRMTDSRFHVDAVSHAAFIEVNEKGTEGATAMGLSMKPMSSRPIPVPFMADHPFLYAVVHQPTLAILYAGKVLYID